MVRAILNTAVIVLLAMLAGCGGGGPAAAPSPTAQPRPAPPRTSFYPDDPQVVARATNGAQRRDLKELWSDTLAMQRVARKSERSTLHGDPAVRRATARFLNDLGSATIDDLSKNRAIDHAAAAVATVCEQCFQQLEAVRPIPAIAH